MPLHTASHSHDRPHCRAKLVSDPDHAYIYSQLVHWASPSTDAPLAQPTLTNWDAHHCLSHYEITDMHQDLQCSTDVKYLKKPILNIKVSEDLLVLISDRRVVIWPRSSVRPLVSSIWTAHGLHCIILCPQMANSTLAPYPNTCFSPSLPMHPDPSGTSAEEMNITSPTTEPCLKYSALICVCILPNPVSDVEILILYNL